MPELRDLFERRASGYEPPGDLFDRVIDRRRRRARNRRVATALMALVVAAVPALTLLRAFTSDGGPAGDPRSPFVGSWAATDYNDGPASQTLTVRAGEDAVLHVTVQDSSRMCSHAPTTMTGAGRLVNRTTLVVPSPDLVCADGSNRAFDGPSGGTGNSYTLILDRATDRLYDNLGVVWNRGAPAGWKGESTVAGPDGPGTFAMLHGEVTFRAVEPWTDHVEAYLDPRLFFLLGPGEEGGAGNEGQAWIEILVNPLPPDTPCDSLRVPPSAEELAQAIQSNPDLEATVPVTERVGRIEALRMDVVAAPGATTAPCGGSRVPVVSVPTRGAWGGLGIGDLGRLYVLDLPGGSARTLAILISARDAAVFEQGIEAAAAVLDSFEFHGA